VLKWPDAAAVEQALRGWAQREWRARPELVRLGVFGSYARGDAGVGSDLDLVAVVRASSEPFARRGVAWDLTSLPVPAEILVYTDQEWQAMQRRGGRFAEVIARETRWIEPPAAPT
jgi:predicted nucleotidyltransferase